MDEYLRSIELNLSAISVRLNIHVLVHQVGECRVDFAGGVTDDDNLSLHNCSGHGIQLLLTRGYLEYKLTFDFLEQPQPVSCLILRVYELRSSVSCGCNDCILNIESVIRQPVVVPHMNCLFYYAEFCERIFFVDFDVVDLQFLLELFD